MSLHTHAFSTAQRGQAVLLCTATSRIALAFSRQQAIERKIYRTKTGYTAFLSRLRPRARNAQCKANPHVQGCQAAVLKLFIGLLATASDTCHLCDRCSQFIPTFTLLVAAGAFAMRRDVALDGE